MEVVCSPCAAVRLTRSRIHTARCSHSESPTVSLLPNGVPVTSPMRLPISTAALRLAVSTICASVSDSSDRFSDSPPADSGSASLSEPRRGELLPA